ncbi:unnamed protein product, partial [Closterium sp. Naga37s-1]
TSPGPPCCATHTRPIRPPNLPPAFPLLFLALHPSFHSDSPRAPSPSLQPLLSPHFAPQFPHSPQSSPLHSPLRSPLHSPLRPPQRPCPSPDAQPPGITHSTSQSQQCYAGPGIKNPNPPSPRPLLSCPLALGWPERVGEAKAAEGRGLCWRTDIRPDPPSTLPPAPPPPPAPPASPVCSFPTHSPLPFANPPADGATAATCVPSAVSSLLPPTSASPALLRADFQLRSYPHALLPGVAQPVGSRKIELELPPLVRGA